MYEILSSISSLVVETISRSGYLGIAVLMALESACIPIPSEIIMPFSGYLAFKGSFLFWQVVLWGAIGNLIGSLVAYFIGSLGGRKIILKYGKYFFVFSGDLERAEKWFLKYGGFGIFFSRMVPLVRTFISFPAGCAKMPLGKFSLYTFLGSLPWSFVLAYAGVVMGENWDGLESYFRKFDWLIVSLVLASLIFFVYKQIKRKKT
jgi:membrane protein DedA with SNARE-associated domain